jgi:hypothetical protein
MKSEKDQKDRPRMGKPKLRVVQGGGEAPPTPADVAYFKDLHKIVDRVFAEAANSYEWTWSQLAFHAGLGYSTVANLGDRQTRWPRFSTIWRLCKAVGWDLSIRTESKNQRKTLVLSKTA